MNSDLSDRLAHCYTGAVFDAMRERGLPCTALPSEIRALDPSRPFAGRVFTVAGSRKAGLSDHESVLSWTRLLSTAPAGHVVVCQPSDLTLAHMGELSAETLHLRGIAGYVVDGGTRDTEFIIRLGFGVACRYTTPADIVGSWSVDSMGERLEIGGVAISTGDYVLVDRDGVVIIPEASAEAIIARAEELMSTESELRLALRAGMDPEAAYRRFGVF